MGTQNDKVKFNVRGKIFETTATTLATARRNSVFGAMFDDEWNLQPRDDKEYFIDRNPDCFSVLLDLLGTGELHVPPNIPEKLLYREAHYYGILDHVRTAKWGNFDGNRLILTRTVSGQAPGNCTAIRASPDGGCAVAHGGIVRVYDWMLEEHPPLNLDYQSINDIGWIDSENLVISSGQVYGRMGLFSSSTGDLRHRYTLNYGEYYADSFIARAICFNSDSKVFASCRGIGNGGIGVWDQVTGKQIDFIDSLGDLYLGNADKIQWLNGSNCLYVSNLSPRRDNSRINLIDLRNKSIVWSRSILDAGFSSVYDAFPMDQSNAICVLNSYERLGFIDLRNDNRSITWNSDNWMPGRGQPRCHYPKLTSHGGQIFCSFNDKISVYCGGLNRWVLTTSLGRSCGGSIRDFSIGGDRLFALHSEENVFDVWETPSAPII